MTRRQIAERALPGLYDNLAPHECDAIDQLIDKRAPDAIVWLEAEFMRSSPRYATVARATPDELDECLAELDNPEVKLRGQFDSGAHFAKFRVR